MFDHMPDLAMDRHGDLGAHPLIDPHQFIACRMARYMDVRLAVGDHFDTARHQRILQPTDRALVARNDARREDRGIALLQD